MGVFTRRVFADSASYRNTGIRLGAVDFFGDSAPFANYVQMIRWNQMESVALVAAFIGGLTVHYSGYTCRISLHNIYMLNPDSQFPTTLIEALAGATAF